MSLVLPCIGEGCHGLAELSAQGLWGCPACHGTFTNDEMRDVRLPPEEPKDPPFDAWEDEQARTKRLMHGHGGRAAKGKRFGKKIVKAKRWYER